MSTPSDQYPLQQPPIGPANLPSIKTGHTIVVLSVLFFLIAGYVTFFSAFAPSPNNFVRDLDNALASAYLTLRKVLKVVVEDTHYKYLALFLIPTFSYFAIANWVGWQYYQNS